eukprot:1963132-Rhodomonas_salina.2
MRLAGPRNQVRAAAARERRRDRSDTRAPDLRSHSLDRGGHAAANRGEAPAGVGQDVWVRVTVVRLRRGPVRYAGTRYHTHPNTQPNPQSVPGICFLVRSIATTNEGKASDHDKG